MNLIFDLDGTLINSLPGIANALNQALKQHHLPTHSLEQIKEFIGSGSHALCKLAANTQDETLINQLDQAFKTHYQQLWNTGTNIYPGITALLEQLANHHQLSILSNKPHAFTIQIIHSLFPSIPFHTILGQRDGISKKPDPSGVHEILNNSSHPDSPTYLIGDSVVDIATANNAKIKSIAVTWGFEPPSDLEKHSPTHTVNSVTQLQNLISTL